MKFHLPLTLAASLLAVTLVSCDKEAAPASAPAADTTASPATPAAGPTSAPAEEAAAPTPATEDAAPVAQATLPLGAITSWDEAKAAFETSKIYSSYKTEALEALEAVRGGADINDTIASKGYNLLGIACNRDDLDMAAFLISQGADVNAAPAATDKVKNPVTPCKAAFQNPIPSSSKVPTALVEAGLVDVNGDYDDKQSLLSSVAEAHNLPLMQMMVEKGADVNKDNGTRVPTLFYALRSSNLGMVTPNFEHGKFLIEKGAKVDAVDKAGRTVFMSCGAVLSVENIDYLESKGADLKAVDNEGKSYALYLCDAGNKPRTLEILKALGDRVDVVTPAKNGMNTIFVAAFHAKAPEAAPLIQYLIERGADPKATWTPTGQTCLHNSVKSYKDKTPEIAEVLINAGVDVNAQDKFGLTPAMYCMQHGGSTMILDYLLKHGADANIQDKKGQGLWFYAEKYSKPNCDFKKVLEENNVPKP